MSTIFIDVVRSDSARVDAQLLLGLKGDTGKSAYQYAVDGGYEGSETAFLNEMARLTTSADEAAASAEAAEAALEEFTEVTATAETLPAGSDATATYTGGTLTFGIPKGDKGDKGDSYDDSVIVARMDSFTNLAEGSTTGDAELIDGRIGADGVTYTNIGGAIRGQVTDVKSELNAINNAPILAWNLGKTVSNTGVISDSNYTALTDIVVAHSGEKVIYTGATKDANQVSLIMYIATYRTVTEPNDTFVARTALWNGPIILDADITGYRIMFGRASASGVNIQQSDITDYFSVDIYRKSASSTELEVLSDKVKDIAENLQTFNHSTVVFETAKSYLNVAFDPNDRIAYSEGIGLFQVETKNDEEVKCISCSQFVQACLSGIDYSHSRYVGDVNECSEWGFVSGNYGTTMTEYGDYLTSNELGTFFETRGQLRELSKTSPQAKVGDILLFNNGERFYHCAVCTGVSANRIYFMHASDRGAMFPEGMPRLVDGVEAGVYLRYLPWSSPYCPTHFVSINDVITDTVPIVVNRVIYDNKAQTGTYSTTSAFIKNIIQDVDAGLYTAKIKDDGTGDSSYYLHVWYYKADGSVPSASEESAYSEIIECIKYQNVFKAIFYAQLQIRNIEIRCYSGAKYGYESMELYDNAINY